MGKQGGSRVIKAEAPVDPSLDAHPWLARGLEGTVIVVPVVVSAAVALGLGRLFPRPAQPGGLILWWAVLSMASLVVLFAAERAMRQVLPLAALLRLSMIFPDHAPTRLELARHARRPEQVIEKLRQVGRDAKHGDLKAAQAVLELTAALSVHDGRTRGHSERVRLLTDMIARELKVPDRDRGKLQWAALLHDIGKLTVSPRLLNKPAAPTPMEWRILHGHPEVGALLIAPLVSWLGPWGPTVIQHHERYDGGGYPKGLRGTEICLGARIVSTADVYDTITVTRVYRRPVGVASARAELVRVAGTQLDPTVVRAFLNVSVGRLWGVLGLGALVNQVPFLNTLVTTAARAAPSLGSTTAAAGAVSALAIGGAGIAAQSSQRQSAPTPIRTVAARVGGSASILPGHLAGPGPSGPRPTPARPRSAAASPSGGPSPAVRRPLATTAKGRPAGAASSGHPPAAPPAAGPSPPGSSGGDGEQASSGLTTPGSPNL